MYVMINIIQSVGIVVGFLALVVVAIQKPSENQKILVIACSCAFMSILAYTLEINAKSLDAMIMALKFGYVGKCYVLLFFLMFMTTYCKVPFPKKIFGFFLLFNTIILTLVMSCEKHSLYYKNLHITYDGIFPRLAFDKGICYWIFMAVMLFLMAWYLVISLMELHRREGIERKQLILLSLAGIIPSIMLAVYLTGIINVFDPVPLGIEISCTLLTFNVVKYGLLDTLQLAKEKVLENTKEGLVIVDPNNNLLYANKVARLLFPDIDNIKKREDQLKEIFGENHREAIFEMNGRNYEIRISQIIDDSHLETVKGYLAWIFDMTFISRYTEEMIKLRQEAEKANLAKTSFLAHMSHEIRTPMNAIIGFSDLCLQERPEGQIGEYVKNIRISAGTLMNLINKVLDISKIESGKMELAEIDYSIREVMDEIISIISPSINEKNLTFRYLLGDQMPSVLRGDRMRVREIIINLLSNAVKYTEEGTILFKIKEVERKEGRVLMEIIVKDTGIGIRPEDKERVFNKFEQFDIYRNYSVEGTGLGLAIVKSLTVLMEGNIEVESTYGEGSIFRARIWQQIADPTPIGECRGTNRDLEKLENTPIVIRFPNTTVLVVDDNKVNLKVAYGLLKLYGIEAYLVQSGQECLEEAGNRVYDMVFMDQMMPEMDGVETLYRLRNEVEGYEKVPVVVLTANALVGVKEEMLALGFDDFMGKPMELTELERILYRFAGEKSIRVNDYDMDSRGKGNTQNYEILLQEGIEAERGEAFCGGAEEYREILKTFAENGSFQKKDLCNALENHELKQYEILVHGLKSSAAAIGACMLSQLAGDHEKAAKEQDLKFIREHFEQLQEAYKKTLEAIWCYLEAV